LKTLSRKPLTYGNAIKVVVVVAADVDVVEVTMVDVVKHLAAKTSIHSQKR
jgi:hypothetical protein